jgi:hypothetical protein
MLTAGLLAIATIPSALGQSWKAIEVTDSITDRRTSVAETRLESGHSFAILRQTTGEVWAILSLPSGKFDVFGQRRPQLRVDSNPAEDLESTRAVEKYIKQPIFRREPTTAAWRIWDGSGEPYRGTLRDIMNGQTLLIRYYKFPEGSAELRFGLDGAKAAIAKVLGIKEEVDPAAAAADATYRDAFSRAGKRCLETHRGDRLGFDRCMSEVRATITSPQ